MRLNTLKPAIGSKKTPKRVGRGYGSGLGRTGGRGDKGQKSRSGGSVKAGFEGGQMPLQRRLPKFGFHSRGARFSDEIRLHELESLNMESIDVAVLKGAGLVRHGVNRVKIIASGKIKKAVTLKGITVTKGARKQIEAAGGRVEE
jgi:large subunit ribosomal protein L15